MILTTLIFSPVYKEISIVSRFEYTPENYFLDEFFLFFLLKSRCTNVFYYVSGV